MKKALPPSFWYILICILLLVSIAIGVATLISVRNMKCDCECGNVTDDTDAPVVTDAPMTDLPLTDLPATDAPVTDAPETDAPETDAPAEEVVGGYPYYLWDDKMMISHRGLSEKYPENTQVAIDAAIEAGLKIIEIDIHFTADNIPVLLHDATINRTSNGSGEIAKMSFASASRYDYGAWKGYEGQKLLKLEDMLYYFKEKGVACELDLKESFSDKQRRIIYDLVVESGMLDSTVFTATHTELDKYLKFDRSIIISISSMTSVDICKNTLPKYTDCRLVLASMKYTYFTPEIAEYVHSLGDNMKIKLWTVNNTQTAANLFSNGADIVLSDNIISVP